MNLEDLSIRELVAQIRAGSLDPAALLEFRLSRIEKYNSKINALVSINQKESKKQLEQCRSKLKSNEFQGRLPGITFSAKHNIAVRGFSMSDGSKSGLVTKVEDDSPVVKHLNAEGALCVGKGNMAEYGKSSSGSDNPLFGNTLNPFDLTRSPGGSTGGDAAAVAAGFSDFAIGGDSGGSLRGPANFCGLFAILPTRGVLSERSSHYVSGSITRLFGSSGIITKTLDDLELIFEVLQHFDPLAARSVLLPFDFERYHSGNKKLAYFSTLCGMHPDKEIQATLKSAVKNFEKLGFQVEQVTPKPFEESLETFVILAGQAGLMQEDLILESQGSARDLSQEGTAMKKLRERLKAELPPLTTERLLLLLAHVDKLRDDIAVFFEKYDLILAPVAASLAPLIDSSILEVDGQKLESYQAFHYSRAVNLLGLPAVSFPTGLSKQKLPLGLQLIGPRFSDRWLIKVLRESAASKRISPKGFFA